jgi:hypothetical protein
MDKKLIQLDGDERYFVFIKMVFNKVKAIVFLSRASVFGSEL